MDLPACRPRKQLNKERKPKVEEDIIDGFTFLAFRNKEELCRAISLGNRICGQAKQSKKRASAAFSSNNIIKKPRKISKKKLIDQENGDNVERIGEGGRSPPLATLNTPSALALKPKSDLQKEFNNRFCGVMEESSRLELKPKNHLKMEDVAVVAVALPVRTESTLSPSETVEIKNVLIDSRLNAETETESSRYPATSEEAVTPTTEPIDTNGNGHAPPLFMPYATNATTHLDLTEPTPPGRPKTAPTRPVSPIQVPHTNSNTNPEQSKTVTPTSSKSTVFGSIDRLLNSPNTTATSVCSSESNACAIQPPIMHHQDNIDQHHCWNRELPSPRGHSPSRERESYSTVSSMSRTSDTPINQLACTLSPILPSMSKADSWLSFPASRGGQGHSLVYPNNYAMLPPSYPAAGSSIFAAPIPPLGSTQQASYALLHDASSASELSRREMESRYLAEQRFLGGRVHPSFLPPLSNSGPSPIPTSTMGPPHYASPMSAEDIAKLGMESGYYRPPIGLSYGGFNGAVQGQAKVGNPFAAPSQINSYRVKKTGKWNAAHVRIAWEVYHQQQKTENTQTLDGSKASFQNQVMARSELLRLPSPQLSSLSSLHSESSHYLSSLQQAQAQAQARGSPYLHSSGHLVPSLARYPGRHGLTSPYPGFNQMAVAAMAEREANSLSRSSGGHESRAPKSSTSQVWSVAEGGSNRVPSSDGNGRVPSSADGRDGSPFRDRSPPPRRSENGTESASGSDTSRNVRPADPHGLLYYNASSVPSAYNCSRKDQDSARLSRIPNNNPMLLRGAPGLEPPPGYAGSRIFPGYPGLPAEWGGAARFPSADTYGLSLMEYWGREQNASRLPPIPPTFRSSLMSGGPVGLMNNPSVSPFSQSNNSVVGEMTRQSNESLKEPQSR